MSGMLKLLFPSGGETETEVKELLELALESRKRVKDQLARIDSTYPEVDFHFVANSGQKHSVLTTEEQEYPQFYHRRARLDLVGEVSTNPGAAGQPAATAAPSLQEPASRTELHEGHEVFTENRKGVSYDGLFGPYLAGSHEITITDPYIRMFYQARNLMELIEVVIRRKAPEDQVKVHLVTVADDFNVDKQREHLDSIVAGCQGSGVDFTWSFDVSGSAHARHIVTDTGWKISLDRGLDIFQQFPLNDAFTLANRLQEHRAVKRFEVTYLRMSHR
jgi:ATP-dependent Lon protease